ncbi:MAG: serpin family protein [Clostridiaceae bacterium]|nr:serpin family protein [Clostridiaceae bacterium]
MKKLLVLLAIISVLITSVACSSGNAYDVSSVSEYVVDGSSKFAFDMFKTLNSEDADKNVFISPLSISVALTMTYNGADGDTKEGMEKVLGFTGIDKALVNQSYKNLISHLKNLDKDISLNIANSIWIREGELINKEFITRNEKNFNAEVSSLDFSDPKSVDTINKWIEKETKGKIEKMLTGPIDSSIIMYIINAIYFKGEWTEPFKPEMTSKANFYAYDGNTITVDMMSRTGEYEYAKRNGYKAIRLPYGKNKTSMHVILPDEGVDINEFIENMTPEQWNIIKSSLKKTRGVQLKLPKFKLEYGIKSLGSGLKALGMEKAFAANADFNGIRDGVYINDVLHKAVIEVNEEGSEAAAATVVVMATSAHVELITFIADRPFIFLITDDTTGTVLFMGKVLSI